MTTNPLVQAYLAAFWPVLIVGLVWGLHKGRTDVIRMVALMALGQWFMEAWGYAGLHKWLGYMIMFAATGLAATIRPAGKSLAIFCCINASGLALSTVGAILAVSGKSLWYGLLTVSWLELLFIVCCVGGGLAEYLLDGARGLFVKLVDKARGRGVAG
jgi:hypothetical protein